MAITLRKILTITAALMSLALFMLMENAGLFRSIDRSTQTLRYNLASVDPSQDIILVEIDKESLLELNTWPWARRYHAELLKQLLEMGADEVAFDIDFSSKSNSVDDLIFAEALENAGGYAYLAAFDQISGASGETLRSVPLEMFTQFAESVLVNIELHADGAAVRFPTVSKGDGQKIPSIAALFGQPQHVLPQDMRLDYRIDIRKIDRISYMSILNGTVDPQRIAGKKIVVGATAIELQDLFETVRFGVIPGPLLHVLAAESVKTGVILRDFGSLPSFIQLVLLLMIGAFMRSHVMRVVVGVAGLVGIEIAALLVLWAFNIEMATSVSFFAIPTILAIDLISAGTVWLEEREAAQQRLRYLATHDVNTDVYSYRGLIEKLEADPVFETDFTVMLVAIKRLDVVRGALGQGVANEAIKEIADRLKIQFQAPIGLISESVFAVAVSGECEPKQIEEYATDIVYVLRVPYDIRGHDILIDVEIATAQRIDPADAPEKVIGDAQIALEDTANTRADNKYFRSFSPAQREKIVARQSLDIAMRQAIERNEFRLAFQPQVDLNTGQLVGVEALIRWHSRERGIISPAEFVALSEETGFIVELGTWVIQEACRIVAPWRWDGVLSVNVSALQLQMSDVPAIISEALAKTGYPANQLCLEVTESVLADDSEAAGAILAKFHDIGVTVAIDDFGTGYSSLSYLSQLNFDKLKIDQSFVRDIDKNANNLAIVQTMVDLAHKLEKTVIAEGMETEVEAELIKRTGCEIGQGYWFGKPIDALTLSERIMSVAEPGDKPVANNA